MSNYEYNFFQRRISGGDVFVVFDNNGENAAKKALQQLPFDFSTLKNKRVLVKPNAGRLVDPNLGINTGPSVVAGVLDFLIDQGLENVSVGDSPILGVKALDALEKSGIAEVAKKRNIPLVDLDAEKPVVIDVPEPKVTPTLKICRKVLEADFVISVPVMKTHMHTQVSLGLKNMKGCLYHREKVRLHQLPPLEKQESRTKPLDMAIAELSKLLIPDLTVVDGIIGQEGLGPSAGSPKPLGAVVASRNCLAADRTAAQLMGLDPAKIFHLVLAEKEILNTGVYPDYVPGEYRVFPKDYCSRTAAFEPPPEKMSIEFENVKVEDKDSCSACLSTVLMFLKRYYDEFADYFSAEDPMRLALGKAIGPQKKKTLIIGNCAIQRKDDGIFIKGCPPVASDILKAMREAGLIREDIPLNDK